MIKAYFENCLNDNSDILIIGAGGGAEMNTLCTSSKKWNLFGIDPSEEMLEKAKSIVKSQKSQHQIDFLKGNLIRAVAKNKNYKNGKTEGIIR